MHERIGKYHVIRSAGSGGFGTVYEGYDVELDRNVAIKVCAGDESQLERFRREARIVSQLKHRNIALVYDFGFDPEAGVHYLVEEFLSGVDLDKKIEERDRLPPSLRLRYLMGIVEGLGFVHDRGLIHRDLSPRNVRVLHDHTIKIMDFGLAKDAADSTLTMIGDNFGTIGYTAPEQVIGMRTVDHRTDIFSFGVIAYEILTFDNPFMADNMGLFIHKIHHHEPRPLLDIWPECPPELAEAIHRCIRKAPEERFNSCSELLPILKKALRYLRGHDVPALYGPPSGPEDDFDEALGAIDRQVAGAAPAGAAPGRRTGDVDSSKLTSDIRLSGIGPAPLFHTPMPVAPVTEPAPEAVSTLATDASSARRFLRSRYLVAGAAATVLAIVVFATTRPGAESAAADPASRVVPADRPEIVASPPVSHRTVFELDGRSAGAARPAIQLLAELPAGLEDLSHCYVLRTPHWSYGVKIRLECSGRAFRHLDKDDVEPGERYTYRVQLADAAGEVLAESTRKSIVAGD